MRPDDAAEADEQLLNSAQAAYDPAISSATLSEITVVLCHPGVCQRPLEGLQLTRDFLRPLDHPLGFGLNVNLAAWPEEVRGDDRRRSETRRV